LHISISKSGKFLGFSMLLHAVQVHEVGPYIRANYHSIKKRLEVYLQETAPVWQGLANHHKKVFHLR
jgi:hypothetical protein